MNIINSVRCSYTALNVLSGVTKVINPFCPKFDHKKNDAIRAAVNVPLKPINGQKLEPIGSLPYGAWTMANNGCEVIAIYNAMLALHKTKMFQTVASELERTGLLFNGYGGTNLSAVKSYFQNHDIKVKLYNRSISIIYDVVLSQSDCGILSCWTGHDLHRDDGSWHTLHTVMVKHTISGVEVYNWYNDVTSPMKANSLEDFIQKLNLEPICLFALSTR